MVQIKSVIKSTLASVGLLDPAKRIRRGFVNRTRPLRNRIAARGYTKWKPLIPEHAFTQCAMRAIRTLQARGHAFGDYLEFGVSRGTSLACMSEALDGCGLHHVRRIGFDSFEGLPAEAAGQGWMPGDYASTEAATRRFLERRRVPLERVVLVKGWFEDTLVDATARELDIVKASLVMVDCDIYSATHEALAFCATRIRDDAVLFFDDWGWREEVGEIGQKEAFAELLERNPQLSAEPLDAYSEHARVFLVTRRQRAVH